MPQQFVCISFLSLSLFNFRQQLQPSDLISESSSSILPIPQWRHFPLASSWLHQIILKKNNRSQFLSKSKRYCSKLPLIATEEEESSAICEQSLHQHRLHFHFRSRVPLYLQLSLSRVPLNTRTDRSSARGDGVWEMSLQALIESYQRVPPPTVPVN